MENTENKEFMEYNKAGLQVMRFDESVFNSLTPEDTANIVESMHSHTLIMLPDSEIKFFDWLKENDKDVWVDLWDNESEEPYLVGIAFLPLLIDKKRGYPICDLNLNDNYYFTKDHIVDKESEILLSSIQKRVMENQPISIAQKLLLQISLFPTDIWHFAYNNKITIADAKKAVETLIDDNVLVHLKDAEFLSAFVDF